MTLIRNYNVGKSQAVEQNNPLLCSGSSQQVLYSATSTVFVVRDCPSKESQQFALEEIECIEKI